jgi:ribose 5-phosphate isomerase RpiB
VRIVVLSEVSAVARNGAILAALAGRGHDVVNAGMRGVDREPELSYIHTGLLAALLLGSRRTDLVVGGCGTGQGFLNACLQYGGMVCGLLRTPLDAWLFRSVNAGACVSLALNEGFGWGGEVNLRLLFDAFFSVEPGGGYPAQRSAPQAQSRERLARLSLQTHRGLAEVVRDLDPDILLPVLRFPGVRELLEPETLADSNLAAAIDARQKS